MSVDERASPRHVLRRSGPPAGWLGLAAPPVALLVGAPGCQPPPPAPKPPEPPQVEYVLPVRQTAAEFEEFGGRTASPQLVELRARVSGYLTRVNFQDGDEVRAGQVLFEIEDTVYAANLKQAEATVLQRQADVNRLKAQLVRAKRLAVSQAATEQEVENLTFETAAAEAARQAAEAARDRAKSDLDFTKVASAISGRIGRRLIDPGNLVEADKTPLATVVSHAKIHAYFDYDERSVLAMRRLVEEGRLKEAPYRDEPVGVALAGETDYELVGRIDWFDNQIDMATGTLRARVEIDNRTGLLFPGMFVRIRVPLGPPTLELTVPEESLGADQGQRFVYIVNDADEIEYRRVETGWLIDGRRVIRGGLRDDDRVVLTGLQRIRPKTKVVASPKKPDDRPAATAAAGAPPARPADAGSPPGPTSSPDAPAAPASAPSAAGPIRLSTDPPSDYEERPAPSTARPQADDERDGDGGAVDGRVRPGERPDEPQGEPSGRPSAGSNAGPESESESGFERAR